MLGKTLKGSISFVFLTIFLLLTINNIFFGDIKYYCKIIPDFSSTAILIIDIAIIAVFVIVYLLFHKSKENRHKQKNIFFIVLLCFFILQFIILKNTFFLTGWDSNLILTNAFYLRDIMVDQLNHYYYSLYPNNIFLTYIFSTVMKVEKMIGIVTFEEAVFGIVVIQSVLCTVTGYLLFHILYDFKNNDSIAWFGFGLYIILVMLSGWTGIAYSDATGLIIPTAILRLYQKKNSYQKYFVWIAITLLGYWGYRIKPQIVIIFIAIILYEGICFLASKEKCKLLITNLIVLILMVATFSLSSFSYKHLPAHMGYKINPNHEMTMTHFLMMGFNNYKNGGYYNNDVQYSISFSNVKDRQQANMEKFHERIQQYGSKKLFGFIRRKALSIFNDGTFAWGVEGGFYKQVDPAENPFSLFLRSFVYNGEFENNPSNNYHITRTVQQIAWILVMLLMIIKAFTKNKDDTVYVMMLSLIGLFLFEILFEARARYIYIYVPIFIMVASLGMQDLLNFFKKEQSL